MGKKKKNNIITRNKQELSLAVNKPGSDVAARYLKRKTQDNEFLNWDDYRYSMGGRGIWGTKIFYRALEEMNILIKCKITKDVKGRYCPTVDALNKHPDLFAIKGESNMWGFSLLAEDYLDKHIIPTLIKVARKLEAVFKEEKKENARAAYIAKKAKEKANTKLDLGDL